MKDIKSYRAYMKEKGAEIGKEKGAKTKLFPLPEITQNSSPEDVEKAMWALKKCSQLTHACYMNDAEEPMRNLWVAEARKMNANLPEERLIPDCAINCVNHSLDKNPAPVQGAAHAR